MKERTILDDVYDYIGRYVVYPNEYARVAHTLWIVGSYFVEYDDIPVFDNFPILAFLSPDEDSGKSRALNVTKCLAYNAIDGGSYTAPSLCREIDQQWPTMITMILDELDEVFVSGKDNSDYIRLLNNGYERGQAIVRASLNKDGENIKTMSYCPKAIAGLTTTKLKKTTRSRMIIVRMRPMRKGEEVELHIDKALAKELAVRLLEWRPTIVDQLRAIDEKDLSGLINRARQIWHPELAVAKVVGGDWFKRETEAAEFFVNKQKPEERLGKKILIELFRCYASGEHSKGIWSETFADRLQTKNTFQDIDKYKVAYYLGENGYGLHTEQLRIGKANKNGYLWDDCLPYFADYLSEELRNEIYLEEHVGVVEPSRDTGEKAPMYF